MFTKILSIQLLKEKLMSRGGQEVFRWIRRQRYRILAGEIWQWERRWTGSGYDFPARIVNLHFSCIFFYIYCKKAQCSKIEAANSASKKITYIKHYKCPMIGQYFTIGKLQIYTGLSFVICIVWRHFLWSTICCFQKLIL